MNKEKLISILETLPKDILINCTEKIEISKTFIFYEKLKIVFNKIINLIKTNGNSGIVDRKRQETYKKAIEILDKTDKNVNLDAFIRKIESSFTEKPNKVMKDLLQNGYVTMEDKPPYYGITISYIDETTPFKNLSVLIGIGIGIGESGVNDIIKMGYTSIDQLRVVYENNKFSDFTKRLRNPLLKYFEGNSRTEKIPREKATLWINAIKNIVNDIIVDEDPSFSILHSYAGSYARNSSLIGDIDYVIVVNNQESDYLEVNKTLYDIMMRILDKITTIKKIGTDSVQLDLIEEYPSKKIEKERYSASIKLWFNDNGKKIKIEIYGYANAKFIFPYFARSEEVDTQKKIKYCASKKGYKLGPWGIDFKDTDISIENDDKQIEIIKSKIGKNSIETIEDIFKFLDYSGYNN